MGPTGAKPFQNTDNSNVRRRTIDSSQKTRFVAAGDNRGPISGRKPSHFMAVPKRKSRMISVRLSEEEFAALRRLRLLTGARSVSDLARDAMRGLLIGADRSGFFEGHLEEFRTQIQILNGKIEQLAEKLTPFAPDGKL
jgi:hypothetical protein